jgi:hypothetical protein
LHGRGSGATCLGQRVASGLRCRRNEATSHALLVRCATANSRPSGTGCCLRQTSTSRPRAARRRDVHPRGGRNTLPRKQSWSCGFSPSTWRACKPGRGSIPAVVELPRVVVSPFLLDVVRPVRAAAGPIHEELPISLQGFGLQNQLIASSAKSSGTS